MIDKHQENIKKLSIAGCAGGLLSSVGLTAFGFVARRVVVFEMVELALIGSGVGTVIGLALLGVSTYSLFSSDFYKIKEQIIKQEKDNY